MKKILIILLLCFTLTGCFGPGVQDWTYKINDNYSIIRANTEEIVLTKNSILVIDSYIKEFSHNDNYIFIKRSDVIDHKIDDKTTYYIVDIKNDIIKVIGTEKEFNQKLEDLKIEKLNWTKTYPKPKGAK